MNEADAAAIRRICEVMGFDLDREYATIEEMVEGIRQIKLLASGDRLTDFQRRALLQNVCNAMVSTGASGFRDSAVAQSTLPRWTFLEQASGQAADAYRAVLAYLRIPIPGTLRVDS